VVTVSAVERETLEGVTREMGFHQVGNFEMEKLTPALQLSWVVHSSHMVSLWQL
jgi:hypothetical protein